MRIRLLVTVTLAFGAASVAFGGWSTAFAQAPAKTVTTDIPFTSHDGHAMLGRLTLPDTPGRHAVLVFVQQAEATTVDQRTRNAKGEPVAFYDLYRDNLSPLNIGFFSYEGRGVHTDESQPRRMRIDRPAFDTSSLDNKVRDAMTAVRLLQKHAGVEPSRIFLRGVSEGTLLAAAIAARIPSEVAGLVLSGVIGSTLKDMLRHQFTDGTFSQHRGHWDADNNGTITPQEYENDPKNVRRTALKGVEFKVFDPTGDGAYTIDDRRILSRPLIQAIDTNNAALVQAALRASAAVPIPQGWVKDHFGFASMWELVQPLRMPIGLFHGEIDDLTPASGVRALEQQTRAASKSNMEFFYFDGLGHGLGSTEDFSRGAPSSGYAAIFDFMKRHSAR